MGETGSATGENEDQRPAQHGVDGDAVLLGSDRSRSPEQDTDGNLRAIDEWEGEDFHAFFDSQQDMQQVMADTGVNGPPVTTSYRILSTPDRF